LRNPAEHSLSQFDSPDHIGPWTRLDSDLDAELMVVGQDWADLGYYTRHQGLDKDKNPANNATNRNLEKLLRVADADAFVAPLIFDAKPRGLFLTNAVLCLKQEGGMQGKVAPRFFDNCRSFVREQIEIVRPCVVVAMGQPAYIATLGAFGLSSPHSTFGEAVQDECGTPLLTGVTLLAVYHCSPAGVNLNRPMDRQREDWQRVRRALGRCAIRS
jgi:uracil-DNA glycosylase